MFCDTQISMYQIFKFNRIFCLLDSSVTYGNRIAGYLSSWHNKRDHFHMVWWDRWSSKDIVLVYVGHAGLNLPSICVLIYHLRVSRVPAERNLKEFPFCVTKLTLDCDFHVVFNSPFHAMLLFFLGCLSHGLCIHCFLYLSIICFLCFFLLQFM